MLIKRLIITGLHKKFDIDIPFDGNLSIFMGPNGIGKSTILNILVHCLSSQWEKLAKQSFERVTIVFPSDAQIEVSHDDCADFTSGEVPPRVLDIAERLSSANVLEAFLEGRTLTDDETERVETFTDFHARDLRVFRTSALTYGSALRSAAMLWNSTAVISDEFSAKILYLPTYRRIEQDLTDILSLTGPAMRRFRSDIEFNISSNSALQTELVKFGMEDIERLISSYVLQIKEYSRQQVNSLSVSYLTAALKNRQNFDKHFFDSLTDRKIADILGRVDDEQLNATQRRGLTDLIKSLRNRFGGGRLTRGQEHISGYFPMLAETHERISLREGPLQRLAEVLNRYIAPTKKASYDATRYEFSISVDGDKVPLAGLSSGEKQIVSLFATLALSQHDNLYVIVDEPELSLSVLWQEILITDIMSMAACSGVVAVTHSPFIYGDNLLSFTKDIGDFTKKRLFHG